MDLRKIAQSLEREICTTHHEHPKAVPQKDSINLTCCCESFKTKLLKKMKAVISKQIEADIRKVFKF